jgi:hypothetical protein
MRRVLASLFVFLMTFALVARGVAAPLMHLHSEQAAPIAASAGHQYDHVDCDELRPDVAADHAHPAHSGGRRHDAPAQSKGCDTNGACCGPVALMASVAIVVVVQSTPQLYKVAAATGVTPDSPDRPPSPPLA